jgi:DNA-binding response OmpR family regulator
MSLDPQPWEWTGPRVLIEHADETRADALAAALRHAGYAVAVCPGPAHDETCPLAHGDGCAVAVGADLVVSTLGFETSAAREVLGALRTCTPSVPLVIAADADDIVDWPGLVDGCALAVPASASPDEIVELVEATLERQEPDVD